MATLSHFNDNIKHDVYKNFDNIGFYVYQIKADSRGHISNLLGNELVKYDFEKSDLLKIKKAILRTSEFFFLCGAEYILYPIENTGRIYTIKEAKNIVETLSAKQLHLVSVHGMSSLRPGKEEYLDTEFNGRLKNSKNIYINDASILPGNTGESPQATIMAFAKKNIQELF